MAAGTCVRSVAAMAYGLCQDAESAPTPAGTITVISWPVFGARTRRCEPGPAPCGQITGNVAGGGAAAAVTVALFAVRELLRRARHAQFDERLFVAAHSRTCAESSRGPDAPRYSILRGP